MGPYENPFWDSCLVDFGQCYEGVNRAMVEGCISLGLLDAANRHFGRGGDAGLVVGLGKLLGSTACGFAGAAILGWGGGTRIGCTYICMINPCERFPPLFL